MPFVVFLDVPPVVLLQRQQQSREPHFSMVELGLRRVQQALLLSLNVLQETQRRVFSPPSLPSSFKPSLQSRHSLECIDSYRLVYLLLLLLLREDTFPGKDPSAAAGLPRVRGPLVVVPLCL